MKRFYDWPKRLMTVIEATKGQPYRLGGHDCFKRACACVEAMTGVDLYSRFSGSYATKREALKAIREFGGGGAAEAVDKLLGAERRKSPLMAQRGDWLLYRDDGGEHLGVCIGGVAAGLGPDGQVYVPLRACLHAWTI